MISRTSGVTQRESSAVSRFEQVCLWEFMQKDVWLYVHRSTEMSDPEIKGGLKSTHKPNFTAVVCTEFVHLFIIRTPKEKVLWRCHEPFCWKRSLSY